MYVFIIIKLLLKSRHIQFFTKQQKSYLHIVHIYLTYVLS